MGFKGKSLPGLVKNTFCFREVLIPLVKTIGFKGTQEQLIVQEKLASLGQLTAGIAHEIQNPLNFVNNFSEISSELVNDLKEDLHANLSKFDREVMEGIQDALDDLETNVNKINEHGKRADSIVKGMLQHSRSQVGRREPIDINKMLKEYVNLAYHGHRAKDSTFNVAINESLDENLTKISVVPQDVSRVLLNIFNNGFYATHIKKKKLNDSNYKPEISVTTTDRQKVIDIKIRDNGTGIPKKSLNLVFNPFFTTKPTGKGTGLGLSISYDIIVKQHKGEIKVDTKDGEFTEFTITLPKNAA